MITVCFRLTFIYITVLFCLRIMGKRQIGELDVSELVTAIFISELAVKPVSDSNVPLLCGILPTLLLVCFEIILSFTSVKSAVFRNFFSKNPTFLINKGVTDEAALLKVRITLNELLTEMRLNGITDITQVYYAILEPNGKISFCLKSRFQDTSPNDADRPQKERGICHAVICDGDINYSALTMCGKDADWLKYKLNSGHTSANDIFLMTVDDADNIYIIKKAKK